MAKAVHTPEIRADYHDHMPLNRYGRVPNTHLAHEAGAFATAQGQGDAFHQAIAALFTAIDSVDSTELDALSYAGDRVVAEIAHTGNADLDTVRAALADAGLPSEVTGSRTTGNRVHSTIELGAAP